MKRDLMELVRREYDLVVVGGGIFGICTAWDAALRGLSVALIECADFGGATSANCFKVVHGGIRYLQHGDLVRLRQSVRERAALLRIAPHLVQPLPIVIPTYGHGKQGKEFLGAGFLLYDLLTLDRNRGIADPDRHIPAGRFLSRDETRRLFPGVDADGLTGAAVFADGQMYSPPRLALAFLKSAVERGAVAANYVEATGFVQAGDRVCGVAARDVLSGDTFEVRGRVVVNAAGPWAERLLARESRLALAPKSTFSRDAYFVVNRRPTHPYALAVQAHTRDPDALLSREARHLFVVPWRDRTIIGVWHVVYPGDPDTVNVSAQDLQGFLDEINWACPDLALEPKDVTLCGAGLVLFGENQPGAAHLSYGKRSRLVDHARTHGVDGLVTLIGVRYTTARGEAEQAVDLALRKLGRGAVACRTQTTPIHGGDIGDFAGLRGRALRERPHGIEAESIHALVHNHGSNYARVLAGCAAQPELARPLGTSPVLRAEAVYAVQEEMAQKLADVVLRRTDLGTGGFPGAAALDECARIMAAELGWNEARTAAEIAAVGAVYPVGALAASAADAASGS